MLTFWIMVVFNSQSNNGQRVFTATKDFERARSLFTVWKIRHCSCVTALVDKSSGQTAWGPTAAVKGTGHGREQTIPTKQHQKHVTCGQDSWINTHSLHVRTHTHAGTHTHTQTDFSIFYKPLYCWSLAGLSFIFFPFTKRLRPH